MRALLLFLLMALPGPAEPHRIASQRRPIRFAEGQAQGARWMLECRDMWDAMEEDGGVYFEIVNTTEEARQQVRDILGKPNDVRLLGVYDLNIELTPQGPGLTATQFLALKSR
ncbi:hypothetical protein IV102_07945 [bacterium]|nr:hypothetical protein [bacterium]